MIYGLTGPLGAGKGEAARLISLRLRCRTWLMSDELRAMMRGHGLELTRRNLQDFATGRRRAEGNGFIAESLAKKMKAAKVRDAVVDGIRNPAEVRVFRKAFGRKFVLLAVTAPLKVRFARARRRGREAEARTLAAFRKSDAREARGEGFGIVASVKMADAKIINGSTLASLAARVRSILEEYDVLGHKA